MPTPVSPGLGTADGGGTGGISTLLQKTFTSSLFRSPRPRARAKPAFKIRLLRIPGPLSHRPYWETLSFYRGSWLSRLAVRLMHLEVSLDWHSFPLLLAYQLPHSPYFVDTPIGQRHGSVHTNSSPQYLDNQKKWSKLSAQAGLCGI